ncbi:MAG: discoidin domain-containing protein [Phycisphaerae bacterium]|nr:discoidin domain-containing protein [Phycisphaerae bacterium]
MNNLKHSVLALVLVCACSNASAGVLYFEDFESYAAGTSLHEINGWEGWYGSAGAAAPVTDEVAFSGAKSIEIVGSADAVQVLDITEGKWVLTAMQYIPSGTQGVSRFHMQNTYRNGAIGRSTQWSFSLSDGVIGEDYDVSASASIIYDAWIELKLIIDVDNDSVEQYYNGELFSARAWAFSGTSQIQSIDLFGNGASSIYYDDIKIQDYLSSLVTAHTPSPESDMIDVPRDVVLQWEPGLYDHTSNVYFGTDFDAVSNATEQASLQVLLSQGQTEASFDPDGLLEFSETYYWRVDEVNIAPDKTVYQGEVWSFVTEPYSIRLPIDPSKATASSSIAINIPEMTINGSGLEGHTHSANGQDMWLSSPSDLSPWLMYEFSQTQKLHQMLIWNSNSSSEGFVGWGIKDVNIEYSIDGTQWTGLSEPNQIARAPGLPTYSEPQVVDFGLALARYVRINILSNWGGLLPQYGVSEVQFFGIPVYARTPIPASGSVEVAPNSVVSWRAGREVGQHTIYVSTDPNEVAEDLAPSVTSNTNGLDLTSLDLQLEETYYWRVDEVNDAEVPSVWAGSVWNLSTAKALIVDDFENYSNLSPYRPFQAWLDGVGYSADDYFATPYGGNGTGAGVGHDIWSPSSPNFDGQIMEKAITRTGSRQSLPFYYDNTGSIVSQIDRKWSMPQDWSAHGIQVLVLYFYGAEANTGQLYVKINDTRILYDGDASNLAELKWTPWAIDLGSLAVSSVNTLSIGVEGAGAKGLLLIDDIGLYKTTPVTP